jgi:hypothetical protein
MNEKHKVIYFIIKDEGDMKITQNMTQKELSSLLLRDDILLDSVNASSNSYYRRKKKGR